MSPKIYSVRVWSTFYDMLASTNVYSEFTAYSPEEAFMQAVDERNLKAGPETGGSVRLVDDVSTYSINYGYHVNLFIKKSVYTCPTEFGYYGLSIKYEQLQYTYYIIRGRYNVLRLTASVYRAFCNRCGIFSNFSYEPLPYRTGMKFALMSLLAREIKWLTENTDMSWGIDLIPHDNDMETRSNWTLTFATEADAVAYKLARG